jgi:hypothetical protein
MSTTYIDRTGPEEWELSSNGRCVYCATPCLNGCRARRCDSCSSLWLADTPAEIEEGGPRFENCPDCVASLCHKCGLSACHDVHDPSVTGAGKHAYDDGECRALVLYDSHFKFDWTYVADCAEWSLVNTLRRINRRMEEVWQDVHELNEYCRRSAA